jgi:DNA invertase Pin-like site-specific DNA recombinase
MERAVIYARYSSEQQNESSIEDQIRSCRRHAERIGVQVSDIYTDQATSGASIAGRPAFQQLLEEAKQGRFHIVIAEALDRLTRSGGDAWDIFEDLRASGVRINTISEGDVEELAIGLKGTMNALFLRELARKTRRGQEGVARSGRSTGGRSYGYNTKREFDSRGEVIRGQREINDAEAAIVQRIFQEYAAGMAPRSIADRLNREGITAPRGGAWNASTINGNLKRGNGVLHNELYRGVQVWGRQTFVKDRRTARRKGRPNSPEDRVRTEVPELRIVSEELWEAVHKRYASVQHTWSTKGIGATRRPKRLLSGLVRCGACGGPMTIGGSDHRYVCSNRRERGACACEGGRSAKVQVVESLVTSAISEILKSPLALEAALKAYFDEKRKQAKAAHATRQRLEAELAENRRKFDRLFGQVEDGLLCDKQELARRYNALSESKCKLQADLEGLEVHQVEPHPAAIDRYRQLLERLNTALETDQTPEHVEAREALRELIKAVFIHAVGNGKEFRLEIQTDIAPAVQLINGKGPLAGASDTHVSKVGAGTGFEPVTFRL